jgi:DNA-binding transcriptional MerR regulator
MGKSPDAFRTISEVAAQLDTPAHVLRFWESKFPQIKPVKRAGGRRYYRPDDIALLGGIKVLLHEKGMTIKGVLNLLKERGVRHVATLSALPWEGVEIEDLADEEPERVIVGPWPGVGTESDATSEPEPEPEQTTEPEPPSLLVEFVAATVARMAAPAEDMPDMPVRSEALMPGRSDGLARLCTALAQADRQQLKARADQIAPLVRRLKQLRDAAAEAPF